MTTERPPRLEFTDCLGCGKRVATTAPICRHCNTVRISTTKISPTGSSSNAIGNKTELNPDNQGEDSHASLAVGGYAKDDWDDEAETNRSSSAIKRLWWYVAFVLLIVFTVGAFIPWFL